MAGKHHQRGCLVISRAGKCIINARMSYEDTGMHADGLCRLVTAVLGFAGNPLWSTLRLDGGKQLCVIDRGDFIVAVCAGEEHDAGGLVIEGLHVAHVIRLTFAAELAAAVGRDEEEAKEEGDHYSAKTEADQGKASSNSSTRPEFASLQQLFLDPLLDSPNLAVDWLSPLRACPGVLHASIVDASASAKILESPVPGNESSGFPSSVWEGILRHAGALSEKAAAAKQPEVAAAVIEPLAKRKAPEGGAASAWCWCTSPRGRGARPLCVAIRPLPSSPESMRLAAVAVVDAGNGQDRPPEGVWEGAEAMGRVPAGVWDAFDALAEASLSSFPSAERHPLLSSSSQPPKGPPQQRPMSGRRPPVSDQQLQQARPGSSSGMGMPTRPGSSSGMGARPGSTSRRYREALSASSPIPTDLGGAALLPRPPSSKGGGDGDAGGRPGSRSGRPGRGVLSSSSASGRGSRGMEASLKLGGLSDSQGLKQHIFAEEAGAKSTRMRAQLGLNTPRKEVGGRGDEDEDGLGMSAYSLVQLYEGTPRKGTPPRGTGVREEGPMTMGSLEGGDEGDGALTMRSLEGQVDGRREAGPSPGTELSGSLASKMLL